MASLTYLVLQNGSVYQGQGFGAQAPLASELKQGLKTYAHTGEVVFNTAMSGYYEVLTDPSYTGQIVAMTYPHMGNYGTDFAWNESGPEGDRPDRKVKAAGFVVRSLYRGPVPEGRDTLDNYLLKNKIPGVSEIDTRKLTLELRSQGSLMGLVLRPAETDKGLSQDELKTVSAYLAAYPSMVGANLIADVGSPTALSELPSELARTEHPALALSQTDTNSVPKGLNVALYDCGAKANIIRELSAFGCKVSVYPSTAGAQDILAGGHDGVLVSNGPGDPAVLTHQIAAIKGLIGKIPLTGICLGHQLISLALGAQTYKMKFGHHGINHPVRDELSKKVFVTSQNHGFAVKEEQLPTDVKVWFRNANDQSIEGIISESRKIYTAQFHPESAPGPYDSLWIFGAFLRGMKKA